MMVDFLRKENGNPFMSEHPHSPIWGNTTKVFVAAVAMVLLAITAWRFQELITTLIIAGIIAYILNPVIAFLDRYTFLSRGVAIALVYPSFAIVVVGILLAMGFTFYQQMLGLIDVTQQLILASPAWIQELLNDPIVIGTQEFDPRDLELDIVQLVDQAVTALQPVISQSAQIISFAASTAISWVGWAILVFVLSIYFAIDLPRYGSLIRDSVDQPGYRWDVEQLLWRTRRIWNGYLRGQTTLAIIMAVIFTIMLNLLGVRYALVLGILAGVLDFFPYIGPFIIITLSGLVAIFQDGNWMGLSPIWFGIVVLAAGFIVQQVEGNWLNPRIVGGATGLHPLLAIIGAIMGGALAGLLGVLLAAPVLATLKLLGTYAWRKMFDLDPFPETTEPQPATVPQSAPMKLSPRLWFNRKRWILSPRSSSVNDPKARG